MEYINKEPEPKACRLCNPKTKRVVVSQDIKKEEDGGSMGVFVLTWKESNNNDHSLLHDNETNEQEREGQLVHEEKLGNIQQEDDHHIEETKTTHKSYRDNHALLADLDCGKFCLSINEEPMTFQEKTEVKKWTKNKVWFVVDKMMILKPTRKLRMKRCVDVSISKLEKKEDEYKGFKLSRVLYKLRQAVKKLKKCSKEHGILVIVVCVKNMFESSNTLEINDELRAGISSKFKEFGTYIRKLIHYHGRKDKKDKEGLMFKQ